MKHSSIGVGRAIFGGSVLLIGWAEDGQPRWTDWEYTQRHLFRPLVDSAEEIRVFPVFQGRDSPAANSLRSLIEADAVMDPKGGYVFRSRERLIGDAISAAFWACESDGYDIGRLLRFSGSERDLLRTLSYLPLTSSGPFQRIGEWRVRDRLANLVAKNGDLAVLADCASMQLWFPMSLSSQVGELIEFVNKRWAKEQVLPGSLWRPKTLFSG